MNFFLIKYPFRALQNTTFINFMTTRLSKNSKYLSTCLSFFSNLLLRFSSLFSTLSLSFFFFEKLLDSKLTLFFYSRV